MVVHVIYLLRQRARTGQSPFSSVTEFALRLCSCCLVLVILLSNSDALTWRASVACIDQDSVLTTHESVIGLMICVCAYELRDCL